MILVYCHIPMLISLYNFKNCFVFIYLFIYLLIYLFIHSFILAFIHLFIYSFNHISFAGPTSSNSTSGGERRKKDGHKTTRVRTVLNEKQLNILRTCYNANPRPDALMKEQLTDMTGLSSRVIRVWFQNKRCKDKKRSIALKTMQQQQQEAVSCP